MKGKSIISQEALVLNTAKPAKRIDIRGLICPYTFVKAKLAIESIEAGQVLEVLLDHEEATRSIPKAMKELGPLGEGEGIDPEELTFRLEAATKLVPYLRLVERERLRVVLQTEEDFEEYFSSPEFNRLFESLVGD